MSQKWVDNTGYFGPDRRLRSGKRLLRERRRFDEATHPPALPALLRRVRVQLLGLQSAGDREHALELAALAIERAQILQLAEPARMIEAAVRIIADGEPSAYPHADALLAEAANIASGQR